MSLRKSVISAAAALSMAWLGATNAAVYRSIDADGNVVFTDDPSGNAEPVDLPPLSTVPAPKYNPDLFKRGVEEGNVWQLLEKDIQDGLKHFNSRVSEEIRSQRDYFKEAMENMIAKKKEELGIS